MPYHLAMAHHERTANPHTNLPPYITWGGRWDSNPRQPEPQSGALPTELHPPYFGAPKGTRTPGPLLRRQLLYPAELWAQISVSIRTSLKYFTANGTILSRAFLLFPSVYRRLPDKIDSLGRISNGSRFAARIALVWQVIPVSSPLSQMRNWPAASRRRRRDAR